MLIYVAFLTNTQKRWLPCISYLLLQKLGTRRIILFMISKTVKNTSISLGSCITIRLRGSCMRLRILRLRMRLRISVLGFASNQKNARNNSESNLLNYGMIFYWDDFSFYC